MLSPVSAASFARQPAFALPAVAAGARLLAGGWASCKRQVRCRSADDRVRRSCCGRAATVRRLLPLAAALSQERPRAGPTRRWCSWCYAAGHCRRLPLSTGSRGAERQGSPDCGKRRRLQATTSEAIGGAPAATCDRLAQPHHRIRRGTFRPGRAYANPRFCTPLCRPCFRRFARLCGRRFRGRSDRSALARNGRHNSPDCWPSTVNPVGTFDHAVPGPT
jgi:hypothetical protein